MAYKVDSAHKLQHDGTAVTYKQTPNGGGDIKTMYLIMHYTAGSSASSSVEHFLKKEAKASAHLVIGRDGSVVQLQAFNKKCWHAGESKWGNLTGMNSYSIGIELDNAGVLTKADDGQWYSWFGRKIPSSDVIRAVHHLGGPERGWHKYTDVQIEVALMIATALNAKYNFLDILGHDDISWPRKTDPGPAFPMQSFKSKIMGRA